MTDTEIPKIPNLDLADLKFLATQESKNEAKNQIIVQLIQGIQADEMAPYYDYISEELGIEKDIGIYSKLKELNESKLKEFEEKITDAQENLGEVEVSDALMNKANYLCQIGDKERSIEAYHAAFEKSVTFGNKLDILFSLIRLGFFFNDVGLLQKNLEKAKNMIKEGGDWDRRNRLKTYEATYLMSIRDFKGASELYLDSLATFTSTELLSYKDFIKFTVLTSLISQSRVNLKNKVINASEILEVIHEIPHLEEYLNSLYNCNYSGFFKALAAVESEHFHNSRYLFPHIRYYVREMRIIAYSQLLESYSSLTMESMAEAFGVSEDFIDRDVSRFIAAGRLHCVIDKVHGIIETNRPDTKNAKYQACIKQGDLLLNRVQKLSRVINV